MTVLTSRLRRLGVNVSVVFGALALFVLGLLLNVALTSLSAPPAFRVVTAARDLKVGQVLREEDLADASAYAGEAEQAYFIPARDRASLAGSVVVRDIPQGRPVPRDAVVGPVAAGLRVSALAGPGKVVFPLPLARQNVVAPPPDAFRPGDRVALAVVVADRAKVPGGAEQVPLAAELFPQGLPVVAVLADDPRAAVLLLEVPQQDVARLAVVVSQAEVYLHLIPNPEAAASVPAAALKDLLESRR